MNEQRLNFFLNDFRRNYSIEEYENVLLTMNEAFEELLRMKSQFGNFIGFNLSNDDIVQFFWKTNGRLVLDVTNLLSGKSWQKEIGFEECSAIIKALYKNPKRDFSNYPGLQLVKEVSISPRLTASSINKTATGWVG